MSGRQNECVMIKQPEVERVKCGASSGVLGADVAAAASGEPADADASASPELQWVTLLYAEQRFLMRN